MFKVAKDPGKFRIISIDSKERV